MSEYERATTSMTLGSLPEPFRAAVRAKAEALQLTIADDAPAFLTHSRKLKRTGMLSRMLGGDADKEHDSVLVIGAKDALIGTHGEKRGTAVLAVRLEDADVSQLSEKLASLGGVLPDDGMSVNGFPGSGAEGGRGSFYFGLGPPEGGAARTALIEAIRAAKA